MIRAGVGHKTGQRMGHMSMAGNDGSMAALASLNLGRRVFVHINNTNGADRGLPRAAGGRAAGMGNLLRWHGAGVLMSDIDAPLREVLSPNELEARLRAIGEQRYHHRHPFQLMLQNGELDRRQVSAWRSIATTISR